MTEDRAQSRACRMAAPLAATAVLALLLLADGAFVRWHTVVNWPWRLAELEHFGSAWCNRVMPYLALLVALLINRPALRQLIAALPLQALITHLLKWSIGRVRPVHGDGPLLFAPSSSVHEALPSGHAALVWTIAFVFMYRKSRSAGIWIVLALFICWARLQTYAHFPSDIFAGAMIGWVVAFTTGRALKPWLESGTLASLRGNLRFPWRAASLWLLALLAPIVVALLLGDRLVPVDEATARQRIGILYEEYLGREADEPGLAAYAAQRRSGLPLLSIARDLLDSDESRKRLGGLDPVQRLTHLYQLLLHRDPDPDEIARDLPLVEDLSRQRGRLDLLIMRLTWPRR